MKKAAKVLYVIFGILIIIGGIYCVFNPGLTYSTIGYVVGLSMVCDAIVRFVDWSQMRKVGAADGWMLAGAILSIVFGFYILNNAALQLGIDAFLAYFIAAWLFIQGIITMVRAGKLHKVNRAFKVVGNRWYLPMLWGLLMSLFGILCMFKPLIMVSTVGVFIGLGIISVGANMITLATMPE